MFPSLLNRTRTIHKRAVASIHSALFFHQRELSSLPLNGITVIDMSRVLAAPYATMNLADLGAHVIKIEQPGIGDETRKWGPPFISETISSYFSCCNRNKQSLAVDCSTQKGQDIIKKLLSQVDVFVENFKPGSLNKYGLDYKNVSKINEMLIYASLSGYGKDGPFAQQGAYDLTISAEAGLMGITGNKNEDPVKVGVAITDVCSGLYLALSIITALYQRKHTLVGQKIDVSLFSTQLSVLVNIASNYLNSGIVAEPCGSSHPSIVPYQGFKSLDGHIVVAANNDSQFYDLGDALGWPWLASNPLFSTNEFRVENRVELLKHLNERFREETSQYWIEKAKNYSFSICPINNIHQAFEHPQAIHSDLIKTVHNDFADVDIKFVGHPVEYSNMDTVNYFAPPVLGQHTSDILSDLGYSKNEIQLLEKEGIIQTAHKFKSTP